MECKKCGVILFGESGKCIKCGEVISEEAYAGLLDEREKRRPKGTGIDSVAKAGYVLGIISICTSVIVIGLEIGIVGLILSCIGLRSKNNRRKAKTGRILSIFAIIIGSIVSFSLGVISALIEAS